MRLALYLILLGLLPIQANVYSQNAALNIEVDNLPMRDALRRIEKASGMRFFMSDDLAAMNQVVSIHAKNKSFEQVMEQVLDKHGLSYKVYDNGLVIITEKNVLQQGITITGLVTDDTGDPIPGVNVVIKGTTTGVVTNIEGKYSISVPDDKVILVFSFVGYTSKEAPIAGKRTVDMVLSENLTELSEVVVTGYGSERKPDITGAISLVNEKNILERQPVSVFDALQGAAAGVQIVSNTGEPGSDGNIRVRGASTMSDDGASPLYIVDGVQMDNINSINPNDIKSINILKDAASAAIYGSRSANGVVLITTKQGEEGKPRVDFQYLNTYNQLSHKIPQANRLEREMYERRNAIGLYPGANDSTQFSTNADNDYIDAISQTGVRNQYDLSISGGTSQLRYRGSFQYLDEEGIIISSFYKRFSGRANITYKATDKLTFNTNVNFWWFDRTTTNEGGVFLQAFQRPPHYAIYFPDGSYAYDIGGRLNPVADARERIDQTNAYVGLFYQAAEYQATDWLNIHGDISARVSLDDRVTFVPKTLARTNPSSGYDLSTLNTFYQGNLYASIQKTLNESHNFTATIGSSFEKAERKRMRIQGTEYITEAVTTQNAIGKLDPKNTYTDGTLNTLAGFFGRVGYNYKSRYILQATLRADGSSRFGSDNRWGYFPSASVGWRFSDEFFMNWAKQALTDGKFRFSAGMTGNQAIGNFDAQTEFVFGEYFYNNANGIQTSKKMGNTLLKWESTTQYNAGVDLTFLNGRITFVGDYYIKNTKDLLYDAELPHEIGYKDGVRTNLGSIKNEGVELVLTLRAIEKKNFSWISTVNWSINKNTITDLPGGDRADDIWWVGQGYEAGIFYGWKQSGVYAFDESNAWTEDFKTRLTPVFERDQQGNIKFDKARRPHLLGYQTPDGKEYAGAIYKQESSGSVLGGGDLIWQEVPDQNDKIDGKVGNEDRQILGRGHPRWYGGWNNAFAYKDFSLSFTFFASFGNKVYNEAIRARAAYTTSGATPAPHQIYNLWKYPGQITDSYRFANFDGNTRRGGDLFLEDGSFIRLQNVRLNYRLKKQWTEKVLMRNVNVFITGSNLLTWTKYSGFDPEVSQTSILKPGNDNGRYPRKREFGFGINVSF